MSSLKSIREEIEVGRSIKGLVEVYEEMAAKTMREIRDAILSSREYYRGLARLSSEVGVDLSQLEDEKKRGQALVLFSSDGGLYGDIVDKVFARFLTRVREIPRAEVYVSGRASESLMKMLAPGVKYNSIAVPEGEEGFRQVVASLWGYKQVEMFFGQFESLARQEASSREVSATEIELTQRDWSGEVVATLKYIYEPDVQAVSKIFGQEIFKGILDQTIKEGELARSASRLMHLDQAIGKIDENLGRARGKYLKAVKRVSGRKQNTMLAGYRAKSGVRRVYA